MFGCLVVAGTSRTFHSKRVSLKVLTKMAVGGTSRIALSPHMCRPLNVARAHYA